MSSTFESLPTVELAELPTSADRPVAPTTTADSQPPQAAAGPAPSPSVGQSEEVPNLNLLTDLEASADGPLCMASTKANDPRMSSYPLFPAQANHCMELRAFCIHQQTKELLNWYLVNRKEGHKDHLEFSTRTVQGKKLIQIVKKLDRDIRHYYKFWALFNKVQDLDEPTNGALRKTKNHAKVVLQGPHADLYSHLTREDSRVFGRYNPVEEFLMSVADSLPGRSFIPSSWFHHSETDKANHWSYNCDWVPPVAKVLLVLMPIPFCFVPLAAVFLNMMTAQSAIILIILLNFLLVAIVMFSGKLPLHVKLLVACGFVGIWVNCLSGLLRQ